MNMSGQPKLFGGSLKEYLEVTGEHLPLILRSCIRVINLYGEKFDFRCFFVESIVQTTLKDAFGCRLTS